MARRFLTLFWLDIVLNGLKTLNRTIDLLPLFFHHRHSSDDTIATQSQNTRYDTSANNVMNDTDTQNQVADSSDIISHNMFRYFSLEFGPDKAYSVLSNIPTQSTISSLFSEQNGKRKEKGKKQFHEWIEIFSSLFSTYKSQIQPIEGCGIRQQ